MYSMWLVHLPDAALLLTAHRAAVCRFDEFQSVLRAADTTRAATRGRAGSSMSIVSALSDVESAIDAATDATQALARPTSSPLPDAMPPGGVYPAAL